MARLLDMTPILNSVKRKGKKFIDGMIFGIVDAEDEVTIDGTSTETGTHTLRQVLSDVLRSKLHFTAPSSWIFKTWGSDIPC